nr:hypothetical protein BaRGS_001812 [Batillaria attramentaria]
MSSPHTVDYRERICINGQMVSKDVFSSAFWHVYEKLLLSKGPNDRMPSMFCLVLLVAIYIFVRVEEVDVAIIEVGVGGQFDQTNVIRRPVVCGITALHLDHQDVLGNTIGEIAWHKAGIFKKGVPAVTTPQSSHCAMEVLVNSANERECPLFVAPPLNESQLGEGLCLGIAGGKQLYNAALAVQLARIWLQDKNGLGHSQKERKAYQGPLSDVADIPELSTSKLSAEMMTGIVTRVSVFVSLYFCLTVVLATAGYGMLERGKVVRTLVFSMGKPRHACSLNQRQGAFRSFTSTVSALWWASLGKNVSLEALARADLRMDGGGLRGGAVEVPDVDAAHVQVLVTGSMLMAGGAIKLLDAKE